MEAVKSFYRSRTITVEPLIFLYSVARFLYIPLVEQYYYHYYGAAILKDTAFKFPAGSYCINSSLIDEYTGNISSYKQDEASSNDLVVYTQLTSQLPAVLVAIIMGPLTDKYGRKLGIIIPTIGYLIEGVASILIVYYKLNPYYFIAVNAICGLTGEHTTLIAACFAYAADVSSVKWRTFRIAVVEAILAFGKLSGQLAGGFWLSTIHCNFIPLLIMFTTFWVAIILYIIFLPESLTKEERMNLVSKSKGTFGKAVNIYCSNFSFNTFALYVVTIALGVAVFDMMGSFLLSVYFLKAIPFEFTAVQISYYQALRSATQGISSSLFFFIALLGIRDSWTLLIGFIFNGSCTLLTGFATRAWEVYAISGVQGIEGIIFASSRGMASKLVQPEQQGALFSIIASLESLAELAGSTVWSYIFPITLKHNMKLGTTYIMISAFGFAMVPIMLSVIIMERKYLIKKQVSAQNIGNAKLSLDDNSRTPSMYTSENEEKDPFLATESVYGAINSRD